MLIEATVAVPSTTFLPKSLLRPGRDLRIDFFRGLALWWIFVDHIPSNRLQYLSLKELTFCDAAELFVLLAGITAGLVYGRALRQKGAFLTAAKILRRVGVLYKTHLALFVLFVSTVTLFASSAQLSFYVREFSLAPIGTNPFRSIAELALLRFQPNYLDILPLYIVLLLMFTGTLSLMERPRLLLCLSVLLYAGTRSMNWALPSWSVGWVTFNPLAWQLLFILGAVCAYTPALRPRGRLWDIAASCVLALEVTLYHSQHIFPALPRLLHIDLMSVDRVGLHPLRLTAILAMAHLVRHYLPAGTRWLRGRLATPFILMGQHSLPVFCAGILLSVTGRLLQPNNSTWTYQVAMNAIGAVCLVLVAALVAWYAENTSSRIFRPLHLTEVRTDSLVVRNRTATVSQVS